MTLQAVEQDICQQCGNESAPDHVCPEPWWKKRDREEREREERREAVVREHRRRAGLPPMALDVVLGGPAQTIAMEALAGDWTLLVLSGGAGCGKTVAAAHWLYSERLARLDSLWLTAARLSRISKYDDEHMQELLTVGCLVVDDLGAEYLDEKGCYLSTLDELVNERHANRRRTLFTTNLNAEVFKARYGERIADRIRESGRFISVDAPSMRKKG